MFGRMVITPIAQLEADGDLRVAAAALIQQTEDAEIIRWIEFPASVLLLLFVPGDPQSGAIYVLDRKKGIWYGIDFEDEQFGGYSITQLEQLLNNCNFLTLVEQPGLWRSGLSWSVEPGKRPEARLRA